ncbi:hypothetical protein APR12_003279 [Nocardia amikacinitolerans]|uniref:hypothetical protein n=1 Tax=Nocardia amikacinitolerans TaxID=756689 RepID=UPI000AD638F9|nr:hypothetical protein [Nocardia amikacinitolerans]MCP2317926.1 hypothetical protein [Nocardia amikacinitolerans]
MTNSVSVPAWTAIALPLISGLIGFLGSYLSARLLRKTGVETVAAMKENAQVTRTAASASERSAGAAERAAQTADSAERQLNKFRLHDDTMRSLYWAADHAIATESSRALLGLEVLGTLANQARDDTDHRARRIVSATDEAVRKVAVPTFLAVLTTAANDGGSGGGQIRASAVEINAARLLLMHAPDLSPGLRAEIELIAEAVPGHALAVVHLYTGRHLEQEQSLAQEREQEHTFEMEGPGLSL